MIINFLLCTCVVVVAQGELNLQQDRRFLMVGLSGTAQLECCYASDSSSSVNPIWKKNGNNTSTKLQEVQLSARVTKGDIHYHGISCGTLTIQEVQLSDTGFYRCFINITKTLTSGTYLKVYNPLKKAINLSESTKNKILTAQGILLLLCVLLPAATLICQSKKLNELEKKKVQKEEENIYQGLNLDDCFSTYDQIERSQTNGPYQDVCNIMEEEEEIQLEKP